MNYEDLIFGICTSCVPAILYVLIIGITFDFIRGLLFSSGRWS